MNETRYLLCCGILQLTREEIGTFVASNFRTFSFPKQITLYSFTYETDITKSIGYTDELIKLVGFVIRKFGDEMSHGVHLMCRSE